MEISYQIKHLVKLQRYKEADILQKKLKILEETNENSKNYKLNKKFNNILGLEDSKHRKDLDSLKLKNDGEYEKFSVKREEELEDINKKYNVGREKIIKKQKITLIRKRKIFENFKPNSNLKNIE